MIHIIPKPVSIMEHEGVLTLGKRLFISKIAPADKAIKLLNQYFETEINENVTGSTNTTDIVFIRDDTVKKAGSYRLVVADRITIAASDESGFLYAVETLRQLLPASIERHTDFKTVTVPKCEILDSPRYSYRGFMIDSCRHFFKKEFIFQKLDEMAMLKLNKFHFHLSDDQGWRIDLPEYPKLKEISSVRARTKIHGKGYHSKHDIYEEKTYGGSYSVDDLKEIVAYAAELCIDVIPEIDSPGHLSALLAAYPQYSCKGHDIKVVEEWGIFKDILCIGNDEGVNFITDIIDKVAAVFPSKHFHIGGDEAPLDALKQCPKCIAKMQQKGLNSVLDLKLDYSNTLAKHLIDRGYKVTGWNEIINPGYPEQAYIQLWSPVNTKNAIDAINGGRKAIDSSFFSFYLDYSYGFTPLKKCYLHNPSSLVHKHAAENIIGVESPLWAEWIRDEKRSQWQTYPKLCATAETGWSRNEDKNYKDFLSRLDTFCGRLDVMGITHAAKKCYMQTGVCGILSQLFGRDVPSNTEYAKYSK